MIVPLILSVFGLAGILAKCYVLWDTSRRLRIARAARIEAYAVRSGVTLFNLQLIMLAAIVLLTAVNVSAVLDPSVKDIPVTTPRVVRGLAYIAADILMVCHALYAAWRYAGDVGWSLGRAEDRADHLEKAIGEIHVMVNDNLSEVKQQLATSNARWDALVAALGQHPDAAHIFASMVAEPPRMEE